MMIVYKNHANVFIEIGVSNKKDQYWYILIFIPCIFLFKFNMAMQMCL